MEDLGVNQKIGEVEAKKEQEETKDDPFNRLPDGLIQSHIFDKIWEAKSLCFCSMVSKRFSCLVYQSKTISIKIPLQIPHQQPYPTNRRTPAKHVSGLTNKFLVKFSSMKSLYVEFDCSGNGWNCDICTSTTKEPVVKWKIDLGSTSLIMLFVRSINDDGVEEIGDKIGHEPLNLIRTCFLNHLKDASLRFSLVKTLVRLLPESLENVVVKDSKKQGGIINGDGGEVIEVKMIKGFNIREFLGGKGAVQYWHKSLLKLPLSGSLMKRVAVIRYKEKWIDDKDDDLLAAKAAFEEEGEEKIYGEAARELLTMNNISSGFLGYI